MDFRLSDEQEALQEAARSFLKEASSPEQIRSSIKNPNGFDPVVWRQIALELGWPALLIPERHGGLGLGQVDLAVLLEATGEALLCSPLFSTVALGVNTLLQVGTDEQQSATLAPIAEGTRTATLAFCEASGRWDAEGITLTAGADSKDFILDGIKRGVVDGASADLLLIVARTPGSRGEDGISVFMVPADAPGLTREARPTMDPTRRLADLELKDVRVAKQALVGEVGQAWPGLRRTLDLAAIALAAEQVGGATRCLEMAVGYSKEREQFGRPIGSFQALKHKCADMFVAVETARSALYYAACIADDGSDDLSTNASLAKAWCSESYFQCASESIQIHGGVGFTWEYDPHLHFKRARASESWLGDPAYHRERVAVALGL
ncbi:MAG: acyl-CoA dehydrogenase family protein [Myxococcales bacterium]|nr:acyl-CoA dehydrogenase [Myxococcales bacterium]HIK85331.1 acyl-CoA dehydrogenase [Myxococcales bacterium]